MKPYNRNSWLDMVSSHSPHIQESQIIQITHALEKIRKKEIVEQNCHHFADLKNLLGNLRSHYSTLLESLRTHSSIQSEKIHIVPQVIDDVYINTPEYRNFLEIIRKVSILLSPWRKGPFKIYTTHIDSEWNSYKKWQRLMNVYDIRMLCENKNILDVGCNNGYYSFYMLEQKARMVLGIDPMPRYSFFFEMYRLLMPQIPLFYEQWRVEDCQVISECFDTIFCMGILYHQRNPMLMLETLRTTLKRKGLLVLETICLNNDSPYCLFPSDRYQKAKGYWFIPSKKVLRSWLTKAGFQILAMDEPVKTDTEEQHRTEWIRGESLENFLDEYNNALTVEGYPAPYRVIVVANRKR